MTSALQRIFKRVLYPNFYALSDGLFSNVEECLVYTENDVIEVYVRASDQKILEQYETFVRDIDLFHNEERNTIGLYRETIEWAKTIRKKGFKGLSDNDTIAILKHLEDALRRIGKSIWLFHDLCCSKLEEYLKERYSDPVTLSTRYLILVQPTEESLSLTAEKELHTLAKYLAENDSIRNRITEIIRGQIKLRPVPWSYYSMYRNIMDTIKDYQAENDDIASLIERFCFDWGWRYYDYGCKDFLDIKLIDGDFRQSSLKAKVLEKVTKLVMEDNPSARLEILQAENERRRIVRQECVEAESSDASKWAELIASSSFVRFLRRETQTQLDFYIAPLFRIIVDAYNNKHPDSKIDVSDPQTIRYLTISDFISMVEDSQKIDYKAKIANRRVAWLRHKVDSKDIEIEGSEAKAYLQELRMSGRLPLLPSKEELEGTFFGGERSIVKGKARVVKSSEDLGKIREGDILFTLMVHPSYIDFLDRVKAIVTEDYAINAHVLTIYHEFAWKIGKHIPLIIGVDGATEVVKDGYDVSIDLRKMSDLKVKLSVKGEGR